MGKNVGRPSKDAIKKRNLYATVGSILIVAFIFTLGFLAKDSIDNQKEDNKIEEKVITSKLLVEYDYANENAQTAEFVYDNTNYKLSIEAGEKGYTNVVLNNKTIYRLAPGPDDNIYNIYLLGDLLALNLFGSDPRSGAFVIIDFNGNIVKEIRTIDENNLVLALESYVSIIDNRITLRTTSITHGITFVTKEGNIEDDMLPYSDTTKSKYGITDDTIINATYTFEYIGDKEFSSMKMIEKETYKEFIESNYSID